MRTSMTWPLLTWTLLLTVTCALAWWSMGSILALLSKQTGETFCVRCCNQDLKHGTDLVCTGINVYNNLTNYNGTSIHFHGVRMLNQNYEDGTPGITECPVPVRLSYIFRNNDWCSSPIPTKHMNSVSPNTAQHGITVILDYNVRALI